MTEPPSSGSGQFEGEMGSGRLTRHGNIYSDPRIVASRLEGTITLRALAAAGR